MEEESSMSREAYYVEKSISQVLADQFVATITSKKKQSSWRRSE